MLFTRKLVRELRAQRGQTVAVLAVTALGVMLFVASAGGYRDLRDSYAATRARLGLADLHVDAPGLSAAELARVAALPAVRAADVRAVAAMPVVVGSAAATRERVELRVLSLPDSGAEPALDRVLPLAGRLPRGAGEVLLEKHFARHHRLSAGDTVVVETPGGHTLPLRVAGVAVSAEYLWVARDESDPLPSPDAFGVGWMRRDALRSVARAVLADRPEQAPGLPGLADAASDAAGNELLVARAPGTSDASAAAAIRAALGPARILRVVPQDRLVGVRLLQMDVDGYKGMAAFFPVFFLGVAAFIVASILARVVDAQRALIGTFTALGVGRARLLAHYLAYALALGGAGALLGAALGTLASRAMTHAYAAELGIPFVTARVHPGLALAGALLGTAAALLAGWLPAWRASRLPPAEAMRPPRPRTGPLARGLRRLPAPLPLRLALRDVLGRPLRSAGTAAGVAAALVLVLTTGAVLDGMRATLGALFDGARRYDLRVELAAPVSLEDARARLAAVAGVADLEGALAAPARLRAHGRTAGAFVQGLAPDARLLRSLDLDGRAVTPAAGGVVLTRALARALGVRVGDAVTVEPQPGARATTLRVDGLADAVIGPVASMRRAELARALGLSDGRVTAVLVRAAPGRRDAVRAALAAWPDAARVEDAAAVRAQIGALMGLGWVMLGVMLACSVVLAAAILFNTATLGILERRRELATLRALGRTLRELAVALTLEHAVLAFAGLALGVPLAVLAIRRVLAAYSNELFRFPFVLSPGTVGAAAGGVLLVLLLAQWPALRGLARASLADTVRAREG